MPGGHLAAPNEFTLAPDCMAEMAITEGGPKFWPVLPVCGR